VAEAAGLPAGVINCLTVDRGNVAEVGNALARSQHIRKISFTGSTAVGKILLRESASTVKRVSMELGGNAPFIVFDDADLEVAVKALLTSKFRNAGQTCISSNRILVQSNIYDKFADMLTEKVRSMKTGNGLDDGVVVGPLINNQGLSKVSRQVKDCVDKGAGILCGGGEVKSLNDRGGSFFLPTVLRDINTNMLPFVEETFGPLAPLCRFTTEEEAINLANSTPFGLAGYACTRDLGRAFRVAEGIETGMIGINEGAISSDSTPFGGVKESGLGREGSFLGIEEYLETKFVCMGGLS
jgi:succinate-semialdehyde dehydrogenase/glutarate-semialdehyde dehydrogenase